MSAAEAAPATVPETLLKKRKRDEQWAAAKAEEVASAKTRNAKNRTLIFKRAQQYQEEYEQQVSGVRSDVRNMRRILQLSAGVEF